MKGILVKLAKGAVVGALLVWLVRSGHLDFGALRDAFRHPVWMAAGLASVGGVFFLATLRWRALLDAQRIPLSLGDTTRLSLVGMFFSTVIPGGVSGDLVKVYYVAGKHPSGKPAALLSIVGDRVLGLAALIVLSALVLASRYDEVLASANLQGIASLIGVMVLGMAVGFPVVLSDTVRNHRATVWVLAKLPLSGVVTRLYDALHVFKTAPAKVRSAVLLSFAVALLNALAFFCFGRALDNATLSLFDYCAVIPLILLAVSIPVAPAGIGVGQAAALVLFQRLGGVEKSFGANVMTLFQLGLLAYAVAGAVLFVLNRKKLGAPGGAETV